MDRNPSRRFGSWQFIAAYNFVKYAMEKLFMPFWSFLPLPGLGTSIGQLINSRFRDHNMPGSVVHGSRSLSITIPISPVIITARGKANRVEKGRDAYVAMISDMP